MQFLFAQNIYQRVAKRIAPDNIFPEEETLAMDKTTDGGYILAGYANSDSFGKDMYLMKIDQNGETEWMNAYTLPDEQEGYDVKQTMDGGFVMVGWDKDLERGVLVIKTDSGGNISWAKRYGGLESASGRSIAQTDDGGFIIAGDKRTSIWNNIYLLKLDQNGDFVWHNSFGEELFDDEGYKVILTDDGGFAILGDYARNNSRDIVLIKTDADGNQSWAKTYAGDAQGVFADRGRDVKQTSDGGYIIAGEHQDPDGAADKAYLIKTNSSGNVEWAKKYNRPDDEHSMAYAVEECQEGGYIFTGSTDAGFGSADVLLVKVDETGEVTWAKGMGGVWW